MSTAPCAAGVLRWSVGLSWSRSVLPSRAAAAGLLFLWCEACLGVWQGELKCPLLTSYTFWLLSLEKGSPHWGQIHRFCCKWVLVFFPNSTGNWLQVVEKQHDWTYQPEKGDSQGRPRGLCLGGKIFLSDGHLDAHRRLKRPSEHRINREKASGCQGMLLGVALW